MILLRLLHQRILNEDEAFFDDIFSSPLSLCLIDKQSLDIGLQGFLYLFASLFLEFTSFSREDLFIIFTILTFVTFLGVFFYLQQLNTKASGESSLEHTKQVVLMAFTDARALALAPMALTFGFISVFISTYVNDEVVKDYIGTYAVGYLGVIQTVCLPFALASLTMSFRSGHCQYSVHPVEPLPGQRGRPHSGHLRLLSCRWSLPGVLG